MGYADNFEPVYNVNLNGTILVKLYQLANCFLKVVYFDCGYYEIMKSRC